MTSDAARRERLRKKIEDQKALIADKQIDYNALSLKWPTILFILSIFLIAIVIGIFTLPYSIYWGVTNVINRRDIHSEILAATQRQIELEDELEKLEDLQEKTE